MISFRVWNVLSKPPRFHPLYRRVQIPRQADSWLSHAGALIAPYLPLAYLFVGLGLCCALSSHTMTLIGGVAIVVLFNGTYYALQWGTRSAKEIAIARASGEWELLCLIPEGAIGAAWTITTGVSHRENAFPRLFRRHVGILSVLLACLLILVPCSLLDTKQAQNIGRPDVVVLYAYMLAALLVSYLDYVQSAVLGSLIGVLGGLQTSSPLDAQLWAGGIFLALQAALYALIVLVCFVLLPPIPSEMTGAQLPVEIGLLILRVACFVGLREGVIAFVWRLVAQRLDSTTGELTTLRQVG